MILGLRNKKNKDYITGFFFNFNRSLSKNDLFSSHKRFNISFILVPIFKGGHHDGLFQIVCYSISSLTLRYNLLNSLIV